MISEQEEKNTLKLLSNYNANVNSFINCASFFYAILINCKKYDPKTSLVYSGTYALVMV